MLTLVISIIYIIRLVDWQIINGEKYLRMSNSGNVYTVTTDAKRGEILDVNGVGLVVNDSGFKIIIDKLYIDKNNENQVIIKLIDIMNTKKEKWIDVLPIYVTSSGTFEFMKDRNSDIEDLKKILRLNNYATAQNCMDKMIEKYKCYEYSPEQKRMICSVRYNMTKSGYDASMTSPYTFADNISRELVAIISEKSNELKGVFIRTSDIRKYIDGTIAPHIVGLTGKLSAEEYKKLKDSYSLDDIIGKSGIEGAMESYLKGKGGKRILETSNEGSVINILESENASPGNTVFLTIDSDIQRAANESLKNNVLNAKKGAKDCIGGAVVVLNIKDFSVLAASTYPSYDLEKYVDNSSYYNELVTDQINTPLINRAFSGAFTPGSIYKPIVACAALEEGCITENEKIFCSGKFYYSPTNHQYFLKCMGVHRGISVKTALARSCNVFFAETGRRLGITNLNLYSKRFGLGNKTGIELYESSGVLAGPEHSESVGSTWYESATSQAAIGQSDNMFTPLQLAVYTATIANNGNRYKAHIVRKITDYTRQNIILENNPDFPELIENVGISEDNLKIVQEGMRAVATSGTAADFANFRIPIAAKTGTAENSGSDHTTFVCYGPYESPEIAIGVVIEHGKSGIWSKNVARDILNAYCNKKS